MSTHTTHVMRFSDSSKFNEICINCGLTDNICLTGSDSNLEKPCTNPVGKGGKTIEEWQQAEDQRIARLKESMNTDYDNRENLAAMLQRIVGICDSRLEPLRCID